MEKPIRVQILGREYPLRVRPEDEAVTRQVAAFVDERMRGVKQSIQHQPDVTVAVLAAMSIAEELFVARNAAEANGGIPASELDALADRLDQVLQAADVEM